MAKQASLFGKISGKIGSVVFSTSGGSTISREYNPHVANPSTMAQVNQRARLKLMSQLSAALAPVIAIPKKGLISSRNAFTKLNFENSMAQNGIAQITYENVQLTNGNLSLPAINASRAQGSGISISLADDASSAVNRVVYILYRKTSEQTLQFVASVIAEGAGVDGTFRATLPYTEGDIVLYAYGMRDTSESANAKYGNMQVANAVDVARLVSVRNISTEDFQFTQTRGATMYANQNELTTVPEGSARVFVTALGGGTVSGAGVFQIGETVTVRATPSEGYRFEGWRVNGGIEIISTDVEYSFELQGTTDLVASFLVMVPGSSYNVTVRPAGDQVASGTLVKIGSGAFSTRATETVNAGEAVTIEASEGTAGDVEFAGWYNAATNTRLSTANPYTFTPSDNIELIAAWQSGSM